jgi:hypothetical protein
VRTSTATIAFIAEHWSAGQLAEYSFVAVAVVGSERSPEAKAIAGGDTSSSSHLAGLGI